jgi:hypothetical protein
VNIFDRAIAERHATMLLASAANSGSNVIFRLGIGVSQTRNHTQTNASTPIVRTGVLSAILSGD